MDDEVLVPIRRGQADLDRALERARLELGGLAVDAARDLAELAVEEDPVVELAAPAVQVGVADEPANLRERRRRTCRRRPRRGSAGRGRPR